MENIIIREYRKDRSNEKEVNRTRPYVDFICGVCQKETTLPKNVYVPTKPCSSCQKRLRGKRNFFVTAKGKFQDNFDLSEVDSYYVDYCTPVPVTCKLHNCRYFIKPTHFLAKAYNNAPHKGGCPECAKEVQLTKNKKSIELYLAIIADKFPDISVIEHGTAVNNLEHIVLSCPTHGTFTKTLAAVRKSCTTTLNLCPTCSRALMAWNTRAARTDVPGIVYFVKFTDVNLYKCGVTYKAIKDRLRGHLSNIEELWELHFDTLAEAYFFEHQFFKEHHQYRCEHPNIKMGGYTEFFNKQFNKPSKRFVEAILRRKKSNSEKLPPQYCEDNSERSPT